MELEYASCRLCPRDCGIDRNSGQIGLCGETSELRLSWAGLHFGEEPPITGKGGSGTIFVTGCNLGCKFCQNFQISRDGMGRAVERAEFVRICLDLEASGAENINIVTGSHAIPAIARGLGDAKAAGLSIPILWNSSAYESVEALSLLEGLVDVWLPDLKTLNSGLSSAVFRAADYPQTAKRAIRRMAEISPKVKVSGSGSPRKILSGVIVRHLALPGRLSDTEAVLRWYAEHLADRALLSLMTQYTPVEKSPYSRELGEFENRPISRDEYGRLTALLEELGIDDGFYQELVEDTEWLPDFARKQPFSSALAKPLWHWKTGFYDAEK